MKFVIVPKASALIVLLSLTLGMVCQASAQDFTFTPFPNGVLKKIPSKVDVRDSYSLPMTMPGLKPRQWEPKKNPVDDTLFSKTSRTVFFREVWQYDFAFTGLRQAKIPTVAPGGIRERNVWYMVYRVRDIGETLTYDKVKKDPRFDDVTHELKRGEAIEDRFFLPRFSLEGWVSDAATRSYKKVAYRNITSPIILNQIRRLEDPAIPLLDSIEMSKAEIPKAKPESQVGVWGLAVWEDVNPRIDFVSVFASGLTNAYRIDRRGDDISFRKKTLQMNFYRPGDQVDEAEESIKYGIPLVDDPRKQVLITQRYALPGPLLRAFVFNQKAEKFEPIAESDAMVSLQNFKSPLTPVLDGGKLPPSVLQSLADAGYNVDAGVALDPVIPGQKWIFKQGETRFALEMKPQFWRRTPKGIAFVKGESLDFLWVYR